LLRKDGIDDPTPVFIIGMPRSGTSLIEQILASHPAVFGAGELEEISKLAESSVAAPGARARFPDAVPAMSAQQIRQVGADYIARIRARAPNAKRIIDKMPGNFAFAGLIHLALPNARLIHTRRDAVDTCFSCFSRYFAHGQWFSYDLGELGRYYRGYEALMEHWRNVLPKGVMLEVDYEQVVADLEHEARRIVEHCGLEWDDACLAFYETQRPVRTASASQVRQPIYGTSVGRWRPYEPFLGPLLEALGTETADEI
jgi:hypothetical protein